MGHWCLFQPSALTSCGTCMSQVWKNNCIWAASSHGMNIVPLLKHKQCSRCTCTWWHKGITHREVSSLVLMSWRGHGAVVQTSVVPVYKKKYGFHYTPTFQSSYISFIIHYLLWSVMRDGLQIKVFLFVCYTWYGFSFFHHTPIWLQNAIWLLQKWKLN